MDVDGSLDIAIGSRLEYADLGALPPPLSLLLESDDDEEESLDFFLDEVFLLLLGLVSLGDRRRRLQEWMISDVYNDICPERDLNGQCLARSMIPEV